MNTTPVWSTRVNSLVNEIAELSESIELILDEMRFSISGDESDETREQKTQLREAFARLDQCADRRESLLLDRDAPQQGLRITEKLYSTRKIEDARLAQRVMEVTESVVRASDRAMGLFLCQQRFASLESQAASDGGLFAKFSSPPPLKLFKHDGVSTQPVPATLPKAA